MLPVFCAASVYAQTLNPRVAEIVDAVSTQRIEHSMRRLVAFETRGNFTETDHPTRGIGAARRWISEQFRSFSPRLQVRFDSYKVRKQGRIFKDVEIVNVVAVLPGTQHPEQQILISGHYDSLNLGQRSQMTDSAAIDAATEKLAMSAAPGASDDASGVAAVLELARVLSQYEFEKTLVFAAFAGEELGLVGATLHARKAKSKGEKIEAVLNSDIIGTEVGGDGRRDNRTVRVFSSDPPDSVSRQLARYVKDVGERYFPALQADLIFRSDRFGRGGDHTPFEREGYAAVRFTSAVENYAHQHSLLDTMENASPSYAANVTRLKAAVAASLAMAPPTPELPAATISGRTTVSLTRGPKSYSAALRWNYPSPPPDLAGFAVLVRKTTSPLWEKQIFVGNKTDYVIPGMDIDNLIFGIKAIDTQGNESLATAWEMPARTIPYFETID